MRKTIPTLALAALALSGCGGDTDSAPSSPAAPPTTPSAATTTDSHAPATTAQITTTAVTTSAATTTTTSTTASAPEPTEVVPTGEDALKMGQWLPIKDFARTRVLEVVPKVRRTYAEDSPNVDFAAVKVELCVIRDPGFDVTTSWDPWSVVTTEGMLSTMPSSWSDADFPGQEYPAFGDTPMRKGQCRKGWLLQEVAKGAKLDVVQYYSQSGEAHWRIKP